ncbi:DUF4132 domain-containing protein [Catenulispora subtropica]|uniref:DUF4132 domain-containing protein n=1 Tax=Catenulispora subtropica TaxID=450798 RepID=A0ABP5CVI5_9ACTN
MTGSRVRGAAAQDPEDVFELPAPYGGTVIVRNRSMSLARKSHSGAVLGLLERRRDAAQVWWHLVDQSLADPESDPELVRLVEHADFGGLELLSPLAAAVVEACLDGHPPFGLRQAVPVWETVHGLPYAIEAFAEYCHLRPTSTFTRRLVRSDEAPHLFARWNAVLHLLESVRSASEQDYAAALRTAARLREDDPSGFRRSLTTFLFAEREDWLWADIQAAGRGQVPATALLPSVTTADQAAAVGELIRAGRPWFWSGEPDIELTYLTAAGAEALPFLLAWHDGYQTTTASGARGALSTVQGRITDLIARVPRDEAVAALIERIGAPGVLTQLHTATRRFPHRALRVLAEAEPGPDVSRVLAMAALADPDFTRAAVPYMSAAAGRRVEAILDRESSSAGLGLEELPEILAAPPWRDRKRKPVKAVVVEGLTAPPDTEIAWLPGERERILAGHGAGWVPKQGWPAFAEHVRTAVSDDMLTAYFAAFAPEDVVRPMLATWTPQLHWANERAHLFVARYESLAIPAVMGIPRRPADKARLLQPFVNPEIAAFMIDGMGRLRSVRGLAVAWLRRHPEAAARCLLPTALGKRGRARQNATAALRLIEADGTDVVAIATGTYGEGVGLAAKEVLADDGLGAYPRTMPTPPIWARAAVLAPIRAKESAAGAAGAAGTAGGATLPLSAAQAVLEMLAISKPGAPYPGLEIVKEFCDTASLGEFAWSLFVSWDQAGAPGKEKWAFDALGLLGDDAVVDRLVVLIRDWGGQGRQQLAFDALTVLAVIGGDRALSRLAELAAKARPIAVRKRARKRFEDVAEELDLSADQLADRVVPDFGLGADGTLRLDYGSRYFDVGFDELLRPRVADQTGKTVKALPKPAMKDDQEIASASYKAFTALKKDVRTVAADQIKRLEKAMSYRRRWQPEDFAAHLVRHPLLRHITSRLVWGVYGEEGTLVGSFRVAEDFSYADVHDAAYEVPAGAVIGVAHTVDLGAALGEWSEMFADYEILQPFDQLGQPVLALSRQERAGRELDPFDGVNVPAARVAGLESRGWIRGPVGDGALWSAILRPVGDDRYMVAEFAPGIMAGAPAQSDYQRFTRTWLSVTGENPSFERHSLPLSELDAVTASVILHDLDGLIPR